MGAHRDGEPLNPEVVEKRRFLKSAALSVCLFPVWFACSLATEMHPRHRDPLFVQHSEASAGPVAVATERIQRNERQIRVRRAKRFVRLPYFIELLVATPVGGQVPVDSLVGEKVALVRSDKHRDNWEVRRDIVWGMLDLPENVFVVKQVFTSTAKDPIEVIVNSKIHRLNAGQILILLG